MNDGPLLVAAQTLFSQDTLISFVFVIIFLFSNNKLKKHTSRIELPNVFITLVTAWLVCTGMFTLYFLLFDLSDFIHHLRFPNEVSNNKLNHQPSRWYGMLLVPSAMATVYTFYAYIKKFLIKESLNILNKSIVDGLIVFLLANISMLSMQIIQLGFNGILISLAIWLSGTSGCALAFFFYNYYQYLNKLKEQEKELKIARLQQEVTQSQLDALSSKINPHFLYNALNSIAGLSTTDGLKTRDMAIALAKLFRYNINKEESNYTSITDEMEMVMIYLEIEKIRFEERLQYNINIPADIENELIPKHLLQPLVENAVKHGTSHNGININISIKKTDKQIVINIGDNGKPFDTNFNPGYGIKSLYDKLDLLTGGNYEIAFLTEPKEVRITLGEYNKLRQW